MQKSKETRTRDACEQEVKRRKVNDRKGLWGSSDDQAQGKSESYGGGQDLEA